MYTASSFLAHCGCSINGKIQEVSEVTSASSFSVSRGRRAVPGYDSHVQIRNRRERAIVLRQALEIITTIGIIIAVIYQVLAICRTCLI